MSTASVGKNREYRVRDDMISSGWRCVMHAGGSRGSADLLMCHAQYGAALVQVGGRGKSLNLGERARLLADATDCGALAVLARVLPIRRGPRVAYFLVTNGRPMTWPRWEPSW